jgi:hypothetical protein
VSARVATGPLKFAGDHAGAFIRGEDAARYAWALRRMVEVVGGMLDASENRTRFEPAVATGVDLAELVELGRLLTRSVECAGNARVAVQWLPPWDTLDATTATLVELGAVVASGAAK